MDESETLKRYMFGDGNPKPNPDPYPNPNPNPHQAAIARNVKLLEGERTRAYNAEAKNMLEAFIIETRSKVQ